MKTLAEKQIFTYDDITSLPEGNYEIIDGERHDMTPTGFEHGKFEWKLAKLLDRYLKDKGNISVGEVGILISKKPLRIRAADVVYISKEKSPEEPKGILEIPPDLIIEIISESNTAWEITDKVKDYLSIGVERIILIDPQTQTVSLYQKGKKEAIIYNFEEEVALLEGLSVKMKELLS
ncbi:MAG: Uma2 family endonuclease [Nitrospirae bacterium]|nr:Uma2 family endonuclease [Nitrospirota bacterium]